LKSVGILRFEKIVLI